MKISYDVIGMIFHFFIKYDLIFTTVNPSATKLWSNMEFWSDLALQNKDWKPSPFSDSVGTSRVNNTSRTIFSTYYNYKQRYQ